ncbi:hypothetical protein [Salinicoccus sp. HZC-1]|uniref:hypothetical protein n=1 Tax=Salinicoccus sp. HZC-1 TaxID=3385497 RepID=UPI00398B2208
MKKIIAAIVIVLIAAAGFFIVTNLNQDEPADESVASNEEAEADDSEENTAEESSSENASSEVDNGESAEETTTEPDNTEGNEDNASDSRNNNDSTTEESDANTAESSDSPETDDTNTPDPDELADDTSGHEYSAAKQCILSKLTDCEGISRAEQFDAYNALVAEGRLPDAPNTDCLECAVQHSFDALDGDVQADTEEISTFVTEYLNLLPKYYNGNSDAVLDYLVSYGNAHNKLLANKDSGNYRNHTTHSVTIDSVERVQGIIEVYTYRQYSHQTSNGMYETHVKYELIEDKDGLHISDYTELGYYPVD